MNIQKPLTYNQAIPIIACAIYCCDKQAYPLVERKPKKGRQAPSPCARLGNKKHSCVLHKLRETDKNGKMTTTDKYKGIQASTRHPLGNGKVAIPDTQVGSRVIDCKFPCPDPIKFTKGNNTLAQPSPTNVTGAAMLTQKDLDYKNLPAQANSAAVSRVDGMTPGDAAGKKGSCKC